MLVDESRQTGKHRLVALALQLHALIKQRRHLKAASCPNQQRRHVKLVLKAESDRVCWYSR
jgi:hypothetical protein